MSDIRSPICTVIGHVDHGKSSILDKIRGSAIVATEAGKITQAIGASIIPVETIKESCGSMFKQTSSKSNIPGLLFIDTPGHAAFTSLRKRGGTLADIAVLVVDINEGFKPQTVESIEILKQFKTPFVIAANKIDLISGWNSENKGNMIESIKKLSAGSQEKFDKKLYEIVGKLHEYGFQSERFDRIDDYSKQIAIVPCSAKTGVGLAELLMIITGLAQKFLEESLKIDISGPAKGVILEIKEEEGMGTCMDIIIYDGTLKVNDTIVIGDVNEPIVAKVKAMLEPGALCEMRDKKGKFCNVKEVKAATGVKVLAPSERTPIAGMPIRGVKGDLEEVKKKIQEEIEEVLVETDKEGIVIKADTIGSLEAMEKLLKEKNTTIRNASVGNISKKDIGDAESNYETDPLKSIILGFNVSLLPDVVVSKKVKVITSDVIYTIIDEFEEWTEKEKKRLEAKDIDVLIRPCKIELMKNYVFRQSNPAVMGVYVLAGTLKTGMPLMKDSKEITSAKSMQHEQENIEKAEKGKQIAVSMDKVTVGRQINEGDILYSAIPEEDFRKLKNLKQYLTPDEIETIKEISKIMRKENPVWGI
ncbi:translation initiation factor IF-2 [Candidatus Woesearchaeota archaeon]|nr:translation initiation factor IF-2 [Candidatus Woesearchaeota archaeon]